ncbi:MAG: PHP domain-containing protein [Bacilli bacterium]|nr:PHP domain-containing protein [Bacilli bacterium]
MKADLHMHTTLSDGRLSPKEVIQRAKAKGVDIIAITDHDICGSVEENTAYAKSIGIQLIPALELSTLYDNKPVHILGYFRDESYQNPEIVEYYKTIKLGRENRAKKFIQNLDEMFQIKITYDEVHAFSNGIIARPHIAKAIVKNYPEYTFNQVFESFIGNHSKAYVSSCEIAVQEGIDLLRRQNCLVVLAHPVLLKESIKDSVLQFPFDGIEAIYFRNKEEDEKAFIQMALDKHWIYTAGSDYHGIENDASHGDIGDRVLEGKPLIQFLQKLEI